MATGNYFVGPQDGWVKVLTTTAKASLRISAYPHTAPFYVYSDPSASPSLTGAKASGTITLSTAAPADGNTVTIGSEVYTFRTTPSATFDVLIGATFTTAATNLTAAINSLSAVVTAVDVSSVITVTAKVQGTQGNIALAKSGTNIAVSGAVLTGGLSSIGISVCHKPYCVDNYTTAGNVEAFWVRVVNPHNQGSKVRFDVHVDGAALA